MANRAVIPVTELDFERIKENLKNYLSTTNEFSDFNYEGAGINILLDLLAYNTHYTGMYANMLAAEAFLDTAALRKSVVSLAKNLGYVPNSRNAAIATVSLTFGETAGVPATLPQGVQFSASKDGVEYIFTTTESYEIDKTSVPYKVENIEIYQGEYRSSSFIYDQTSNFTKFEIPSEFIDKDFIEVIVANSASDLTNADINWKKSTDFLKLTPTSKVYFINENYRGKYDISFGDGILGRKPEKGNYILVVYFETQGTEGNDIGLFDTSTTASSFSFLGINGNKFDSTVTTVAPSTNGAEKEGINTIRYYAPKYYQSNDRAVTVKDYESIVMKDFSDAAAVRVWGGEENNPPEYGAVFVSVLPKNSQYLSDSQKTTLVNDILGKKKIVGLIPKIVDVDYTYVLVECFATYSSSIAFITESSVRDALNLSIAKYSDINLGVFGNPFRYSTLSRYMELSGNNMVSSRINSRLLKKIFPVYGASNYTLDFNIPLLHPFDGNQTIVSTSTFKHRDALNVVRDCFIEDNGRGRLVMYRMDGSTKKIVNANIGSINYETGLVNLIGFAPVNTGSSPYVKFIVTPDQRFDIVPARNQILKIDPSLSESIKIILQDSAIRRN